MPLRLLRHQSMMMTLLMVCGLPTRSDGSEPISELKGLSSLLGEWTSESQTAGKTTELRTIRYAWINDGRSLEANSERRVGDSVVRMHIVYFWDAAGKKIRALTVGSDGSWGLADVEIDGKSIRLISNGGLPNGRRLSLVSTLESSTADVRTERWTKVRVDDTPQPDPPVIEWRRKGTTSSSAAPASPPTSATPPSASSAGSSKTWRDLGAARQAVLDRYLRAANGGYAWFAYAMHGEQAGTPYLFFRSLAELAPDIWGPSEERFARFGFFDEPGDSTRPLPLGLGWVLDPVHGDGAIPEYHTVTLTCAACHVGKVQADKPILLVGAPNTTIDVRKFRRAMELTADRLLSEASVPETAARLADVIKSKPPGYYFRGRYGIDAEMEERERDRFADPKYAIPILAGFGARVQGGRAAVLKQLKTSYARPNAPPLDGGTPGQSDGSGDLIPKLLLFREVNSPPIGDAIRRFLSTTYPEMPASATATDNLSVWNQADRPFGQLDASIRSPVIRNVAAETAVVGSAVKRNGDRFTSAVNVVNADLCASFLAWLPSPPYPFQVNLDRARRGEVLFQQHCVSCHRAGNGNVYGADKIGTDTNRARVLSQAGKDLLVGNFKAAIPADYVATTADGAIYRPALLSDDEIINDRVRPDRQGYAAGPLDGIWARAPYLHNGSVPTLRHLLAPGNASSRRPAKFIRGSMRYDTSNVGFCWDLRDRGALLAESATGVVFDTSWDGASNQGHQADVTVDGKVHRLDWSGPEHAEELEALLEYLKTL